MADDIGGVWRTIGGRRVFIKTGQSLSQAMKASGKFKTKKKKVSENAKEYQERLNEIDALRNENATEEQRKKADELEKELKTSEEYKKLREDYKKDSDRRAFATENQDALEKEYEKKYGSDYSKWEEFTTKKMLDSFNKEDQSHKEFEKERDEINNKRGRQYDEAKKIQDVKEAQTIQSVSKLVQLEMNDTGDESVDQFVNRLIGKSAKSVEAKRTELNKRLEHASEEYRKYAKSLNYTEKFRDEFEYWDRERKLYAELVNNYDKLHKKKTKATNAPLF